MRRSGTRRTLTGEKSPEESDRLEGLAQTHIISEDASVTIKITQPQNALKHKLDALPLVLAKKLAEERLDHDGVWRDLDRLLVLIEQHLILLHKGVLILVLNRLLHLRVGQPSARPKCYTATD